MEVEKVYYSTLLDAEWEPYDDYKVIIQKVIKEFNPKRIMLEFYYENLTGYIFVYLAKDKLVAKPNQLCQEDFETIELNRYYDFHAENYKDIRKELNKIRNYIKRNFNLEITTRIDWA